MAKSRAGQVFLSDGHELYEKVWEPEIAAPKANLIFLHGFSDHSNCYYELFPTLASPPYNIAVHALDQRGWGRSVHKAAEKGLTGPTSQVLQDIHEYVSQVWKAVASKSTKSNGSSPPLFLMGHSMGGQQSLHYLLSSTSPYNLAHSTDTPIISALLLESPYIALHPASQPSSVIVSLGKVAARLLPERQMVQRLDATYMSRSAKTRDDWVNDPLCHDTGTLRGLADMLERSAMLDRLGRGEKVAGLRTNLPEGCVGLWLGHGDADRTTSFEASRRLFDVLKLDGEKSSRSEDNKIFNPYEGGYHKLHGEPDGMAELFAKDVGDFILKTTEGMSSSGSAIMKPKL